MKLKRLSPLWMIVLFIIFFSKNSFSYFNLYADTFKKPIVTAAKKDTAIYIQYVLKDNISNYFSIDTALNGLQNFNPVLQQRYPYTYLGNTGAAHHELIFNPLAPSGFDVGFHQFDLYNVRIDEIKYYNTTKAFTDISLVLGKKEEQIFKITHTQNILPNWNFGFDYQKISSEGLYQRQKTNNQSLDAFTRFQTRDKRYNFLLSAVNNRITVQENGGMTIDTLFEDDFANNEVFYQRGTVPVRLSAAENHRKEKTLFAQHSFDFGKKYEKKINDSVSVRLVFPTSRLTHSFQLQNTGYAYRDDAPPDSGIYPIAYYSYELTSDSLHLKKYSNSVSFQTIGNSRHIGDSIIYSRNIFEVGFNYDFFEIYQSPSYDNLFSDTILGNVSSKFLFASNPNHKGKFIYSVSSEYVIDGYNKEDFSGSGKIGYRFSERYGTLDIHFISQKSSPAWISQYYFGNNFQWNNNFKKIKTNGMGLNYSLPKNNFALEFHQYSVDNFVYWDSISQPKQANKNIQASVFCLRKDLVWKNIHLNNFMTVQFFSNEKYIHKPNYTLYHSWFYHNHLFKKALFAQIGFDVRYSSGYFADAYMPATGQFYLQNKKMTKLYPSVDLFINMKVKRARLFFKVENLGQKLIGGNGYYSTPYYPMPDRVFKAGINWRFYN